jgi:hypothetical protein
MSTLKEKRQAILHGLRVPSLMSLGKFQTKVNECLNYWDQINFLRRLWQKDPTLWFKKPVEEITNRMGWLV